MSLGMNDFDLKVREAVRTFWKGREKAERQQAQSGKFDRLDRASGAASNQMDGFLAIVRHLVAANGLPDAQVEILLTLPGCFRPTTLWDAAVIHEGRLVAALQLKSQVGPSFENIFNNHAEESIGAGLDLRGAFSKGAFGESPAPFVGWMMMLEECAKSRAPVKDSCKNFPLFPEFDRASYSERYNMLCKRLVKEQLYTAAALLLSPRTGVETGEYAELSEMTSVRTFFAVFAARVAAEAAIR